MSIPITGPSEESEPKGREFLMPEDLQDRLHEIHAVYLSSTESTNKAATEWQLQTTGTTAFTTAVDELINGLVEDDTYSPISRAIEISLSGLHILVHFQLAQNRSYCKEARIQQRKKEVIDGLIKANSVEIRQLEMIANDEETPIEERELLKEYLEVARKFLVERVYPEVAEAKAA